MPVSALLQNERLLRVRELRGCHRFPLRPAREITAEKSKFERGNYPGSEQHLSLDGSVMQLGGRGAPWLLRRPSHCIAGSLSLAKMAGGVADCAVRPEGVAVVLPVGQGLAGMVR